MVRNVGFCDEKSIEN